MKRLILFLILTITAGIVLAGPQYLRNTRNRLLYGPVDSKGTPIELPAGKYESITPSDEELKVISALQSLIIPELELSNAPVAVAIMEINREFRKLAGINAILVSVDVEGYYWRHDIQALCSISEEGRTNIPLFSVSGRYISMYQALELISDGYDLPVNIMNGNIILSQKKREVLSAPRGRGLDVPLAGLCQEPSANANANAVSSPASTRSVSVSAGASGESATQRDRNLALARIASRLPVGVLTNATVWIAYTNGLSADQRNQAEELKRNYDALSFAFQALEVAQTKWWEEHESAESRIGGDGKSAPQDLK